MCDNLKDMEQPQYLSISLTGNTLLEASAGTGKTFTVALLYLRALLGMGTPNNRPLKVKEILVVTFTNAATEELIERVRLRIKEALVCLSDISNSENDSALVSVLQQAKEQYRLDNHVIKERLESALSNISFARISTIHSFCADLLNSIALDAGLPMNVSLTTDGAVLDDAINDGWRENIEKSTKSYSSGKVDSHKKHASVYREFLSKGQSTIQLDENEFAIETYLACLPDKDVLDSFFSKFARLLNGDYKKENVVKENIEALYQVSKDVPSIASKTLRFFACSKLKGQQGAAALKKEPDLCEEMDVQVEQSEFFKFCEKAIGVKPRKIFFVDLDLYHQSHQNILGRVEQNESLTSELHSDRLIQLAAQASEQKEVANKLRKELPLAIIDEFQDTDPFQYQLFNNIYGSLNLEEENSSSGLIMVGDPKQAIYGFRGGDIYTYLKAKPNVSDEGISDEETVGEKGLLEKQNQVELRTLTQNFRSTEQIVQGIEQIFLNRQQHSPEFEPFNHPKIPFVKVTAGASQSELIIEQNDNGKPLQAITGVYLDDNQDASLNAASKKSLIAKKSAEYVKKLLALSENGKCFFQKKGSGQRSKLKPSDICLLVNVHSEASLLKKALHDQNVPSLTQARNSVLEEQEAYDCWLVLKAILNPSDKHSAQEALLAKMSGLGYQGALAITSDEDLMRQCVSTLHKLNDVLKYKGPMVAIKRWLSYVGASSRLMKVEHDRESTNIHQVLELLQDEFCQVGGGLKLLTRFEQSMQATEQAADERLIRLESDEDRVKIVTIHTSKGLEYPIVLLPFGWNDSIQNRGPLYSAHSDNGDTILGFNRSKEAGPVKKAKEKELRDEKLRLFYVALTRASHHLAVFFIDSQAPQSKKVASGYNKSVLAHYFPTENDEVSVAEAHKEFEDAVSKTNGDCIALDDVQEPITGTPDYAVNDENETTQQPRIFKGEVAQHIGVSSFSMLTRGYHLELKDQDEESEMVTDVQVINSLDVPDRFTLAKGAHIGTALHNVLEYSDFVRWKGSSQEDRTQSLDTLLTRELKSNGVIRNDKALKEGLPAYRQWMMEVLQTPFHSTKNEDAIALQDIEHWFPELDFTFQMENSLSRDRLEALLKEHGEYTISGFKGIPIHGMLQGAIDLIFCHNDKYYLADYKSNHLGDDFDAYDQEGLRRSILEKGYRLQYLIYTLALHLHLSQRLDTYDYDTHVGGAYYLYLRGMHPDHPGSGVFFDRPPKALIDAMASFFNGELGQTEDCSEYENTEVSV